jgi:hypothetical protein
MLSRRALPLPTSHASALELGPVVLGPVIVVLGPVIVVLGPVIVVLGPVIVVLGPVIVVLGPLLLSNLNQLGLQSIQLSDSSYLLLHGMVITTLLIFETFSF